MPFSMTALCIRSFYWVILVSVLILFVKQKLSEFKNSNNNTNQLPITHCNHSSKLYTAVVNEYDTDTDFDPNVTKYWFHSIVDHFNYRPTIESTFPLRYYVNDQYYIVNSSSPVIFYAGNEADITLFIKNCGFLWEIASQINAMIVFAEHRYYGESYPLSGGNCAVDARTTSTHSSESTKYCNKTASLSPQNISYLTVEQAMEDYNTLQVHVREQWNMTKDTAFIVTGGSYGANLALWLRLKNANMWAGALACSATPLKHILRETNSFARIVSDAYGNVSEQCPILIRKGWYELQVKSKTPTGRIDIQQQLQLCSIPSLHQKQQNQSNDQMTSVMFDTIHGWISDALVTMVQYGYPYPNSFYNPVPGYPFKVAFEGMLQETTGLGALRVAAQVYYNDTGQAGKCFDWFSTTITNKIGTSTMDGSNSPQQQRRQRQQQLWTSRSNTWKLKRQVQPHTNVVDTTDWENIAWDYQCCTEVYQPMPTDGVTDIEIPYIPNETEYFEQCQQRWDGVTPRPNWEEMTFWSNNIQAGSNIFLSNGQLDPWRAAGIQSLQRPKTNSSDSASSIIIRTIENGAHHFDLRASHPLDPPSVVKVRQEELQAVRRWVQEWKELYST
jgi:lysosomal Pro-X carboxypeptidase